MTINSKFLCTIMILISVSFSRINPDQGSIVEVELLDSMSAEEIYNYLNPILDIFTPLNGYDVDIYSITYETIDSQGNITLASGALAVPDIDNGYLPLLSYQHGFQQLN